MQGYSRWVLVGAIALTAMATLNACRLPAPEEQQAALVEPVAQAAVEEPDLEGIVADAAFLHGEHLYLRTAEGSGATYGNVHLDEGAGTQDPAFAAEVSRILPIEDLHPAQWLEAEVHGRPVPVFGAERWRALLRVVQILVTPEERDYGAVLDILGEQEVFLYYDEDHALRAVPMVYKPESVRVKATYRLADVAEEVLGAIRQALSEESGPPSQALINTGDETQAGYPFVYLDFERKQVRYLRATPERWTAKGPSKLSTGANTAVHLTKSHVRAVFHQPVTSVVRLFTLTTRTATSLIDPRGLLPPEHGPIPPVSDGPGMDVAEWEATLDRITMEKTSHGRISYLVDGEAYFARLIDTVSSAQQSLQLRTYIFDNDDYALRFAELLKRRSNENVKVKVMMDGLGTIAGAAAQPSHQTSVAYPAVPIDQFLRQDSNVKVQMLSNPWFAGDHSKVTIVDDRVAFLGGMNIGREYRYEWHDMMVELTGPVVDYLRDNYEKIWTKHQLLGDFRVLFKRVKPVNPLLPDDYPVRILRTDAQITQILKAQIAAIRNAKQRIYIQNAYFTSDPIIYELAMARRRGVDVRVILPYRNDSGLINRSNAIASNRMLAQGIRVYIYPGMSHLKGAVYDGWACIGSANFDALSFQVNRELNVATSHAPAVQELVNRVFLPDMEKSVELTQPFPKKWHDFLVEMLADRL